MNVLGSLLMVIGEAAMLTAVVLYGLHLSGRWGR